MKTVIFLADFKEFVFSEIIDKREIAKNCSRELISDCIDFHIKNGLKYNSQTGKTINLDGIISEYVHTDEIPVYDNSEQAAFWQFAGIICNSISKIQRGYGF